MSQAPQRRPPKLVSVVIPAFNAAGTLAAQLEALEAQTYPGRWEVIVADNGSSDGTVEIAHGWRVKLPQLRVIGASGRRGANFARNLGAREARGDLLLFCDADDVVTPGWIAGMVAAAPLYDIVGGRLDVTTLNDPVARSWKTDVQTEDLSVSMDFLPFVSSANLGVWAEVHRELGGWREEFLRSQDVEFSWRAQLATYRLGFAPDGVVQRRYRRSLAGLARQFFGWGVASVQLYRAFRPHGFSRRTTFTRALRSWAGLLLRAPLAVSSREFGGRWVATFAYRCGRLRGCVRYRVWFP